MLKPIFYLVQKEFRQVFRQRAMVAIIFIAPLVQLLIFAYAVTTDLRNVRLAVLDQDRTPSSRRLVSSFFTSGYFSDRVRATRPDELTELLQQGVVDMTLWIPPGYGDELATGGAVEVAIAVDGSHSSIAGLARGYAEAIVRREMFQVVDELLLKHPQAALRMRHIEPVARFYYNPQLESRYYMVPGIVVMILTVVSGLLTGMAVVREKEVGTLEQLMVSPLTPLQLIAGKTIPFTILAFFELSIATAGAVWWFKLPLAGSVPLLALCALAYLLVTLGVGILASTVSQTQQQAMFTVWFFLVFGVLMSGFFYPVENMPDWVRMITHLNPMRYMMAIVRGIFLKGAGLPDILPELLPMTGLGVVIFTAAVLRFRKRLA